MKNETRTLEQLQEHYAIERDLADRLRAAPRDERLKMYGLVYDELFRRVPLHPQLTRKADPATYEWAIARQVRIIEPFLPKGGTFLEVGAGDCALSAAVARTAGTTYAVDVSESIMARLDLPENVTRLTSDGTSIPVPPASVDVAYSNQVMEHLHPDDAHEQLQNIYAALVPGGSYICITPNSLTGPHDISKYFDERATGFHLREYTFGELRRIFEVAGFRTVSALVGGRGRYARVPRHVVEGVERVLERFPVSRRRAIADRLFVSGILGIRIVGRK